MAASLYFSTGGKVLTLLHVGRETSAAPGCRETRDTEDEDDHSPRSPGEHRSQAAARLSLEAVTRMSMDEGAMSGRIRDLALDGISLLIGEDYAAAKKSATPTGCSHQSGGAVSAAPPPHRSLILNRANKQRILEAANHIAQLVTGEVPVRCQDVAVYFSMEEREYLERNKDHYRDVTMMEKDRTAMDLFLEIIHLLAGEQGQVVMKTSEEYGSPRTSPAITATLPPEPGRGNQQRLLWITNQITELLTGEATIRCQDVAVYLSLEELQYLEENKDHYREAMMKDQQTPTSLDGCHRKTNSQWSATFPPEGTLITPSTYKQQSAQRSPASEKCSSFQHRDFTCSHSDSASEATLTTHSKKQRNEGSPKLWRKPHTGVRSHPCPYCALCFSRKDALEEHVLVHTRKQSEGNSPEASLEVQSTDRNEARSDLRLSFSARKALLCEKGFPEKASLESHNAVRSYPCSQCEKSFTSKKTLVTHQKVHASLECGKKIKYKSSLQKHLHAHASATENSCSKCGKCFSEKASLEAHLKDHEVGGSYSCSECGRSFTSMRRLAAHREAHASKTLHSCSECGKSFTSMRRLAVHRKVHTSKTPYSCSECGKQFKGKAYLQKHLARHTGVRKHACPECGKCFFTSDCIKRHLVVHTRAYPFTCAECGKGFTRKTMLHVHMADHVEDCSCSQCSQSFNNRHQLLLHQASHNGGPSISCSECGKLFCSKRALIVHQKVHTGEAETFPCPECGKCYLRKVGLQFHLLTHTGELPFTCSECGRGFRRKEVLDKHLRTHTGERPFRCPECGKRFSQRFSLTEHVKRHIGVKH